MVKADFDIRNAKSINDIVDCIEEGTYGDAPQLLIQFFEDLPKTPEMNFLRTLSVPFLFHDFEKNITSDKDPIKHFSSILLQIKMDIESLGSSSPFSRIIAEALETAPDDYLGNEVKTYTGQHYGTLFKAFDQHSYFEEAKRLLSVRLERNQIQLKNLPNAKVLDQGCGGGRYTTAWKLLGAKSCVGLDYSEIGLEDAKNRVKFASIKNIKFVQGSVFEMPFSDETFDIVYSNGVLHHTENWKKGIEEQLRVMKPGAWGWQYLIEKPGGIFWDQIEILRAIMRWVPKPFAQQVMRGLGIPANRIFYMLDHVMVPINTRLTSDELIEQLEKSGAKHIKRLIRGADFDRVEAIYRKVPGAKEKFGAGENRFVFHKSN
uniref:class I SAM-dependent methyltransferase n=1 Tax=Algoriphagus sp. TaxID=1872435 RepID=UPI0025843EC6|nr:class I SAM-dependent methyltransferase [Algoriphagus sp.]